jgi:hypothetical protein
MQDDRSRQYLRAYCYQAKMRSKSMQRIRNMQNLIDFMTQFGKQQIIRWFVRVYVDDMGFVFSS